jgi:hypothetical protein
VLKAIVSGKPKACGQKTVLERAEGHTEKLLVILRDEVCTGKVKVIVDLGCPRKLKATLRN